MSTTTIDVPLFFQPAAFDLASAPPLPGHQPPSSQPPSIHPHLFPDSQGVPPPAPPPPPRKIPLDLTDDHKFPKMIPKRPQYDPQHSYSGDQEPPLQRLQRPRFDPQNSHDGTNSPPQSRHQERKPTIPAPQFTSFNVESALPPVESGQRSLGLHHSTANVSSELKSNREHNGQDVHRNSASSVASAQTNPSPHRSRTSTSETAYIPVPEQQHAHITPIDIQSMSTNDHSLGDVGNSTSEPRQAIPTYKEHGEHASPETKDRHYDDSFYWHSGRSSSDAESHSQNSSPIITPEDSSAGEGSSATNSTVVQHDYRDLPIRSTSLSPSISAPYGASALGFGGPSDWEYFGDYEAEEIDDEELYSRPRTKDPIQALQDTAELPADYPSIGARHQSDNLANFDGASAQTVSLLSEGSRRQVQTGNLISDSHGNIRLSHSDVFTDAVFLGRQSPPTPRPLSDCLTAQPNTSPDQRLDLDEVIRAWSEASHVGKTLLEQPLMQNKTDRDDRFNDLTEPFVASGPHEKISGIDEAITDALPTPKAPFSTNNDTIDRSPLQQNNDSQMILSEFPSRPIVSDVPKARYNPGMRPQAGFGESQQHDQHACTAEEAQTPRWVDSISSTEKAEASSNGMANVSSPLLNVPLGSPLLSTTPPSLVDSSTVEEDSTIAGNACSHKLDELTAPTLLSEQPTQKPGAQAGLEEDRISKVPEQKIVSTSTLGGSEGASLGQTGKPSISSPVANSASNSVETQVPKTALVEQLQMHGSGSSPSTPAKSLQSAQEESTINGNSNAISSLSQGISFSWQNQEKTKVVPFQEVKVAKGDSESNDAAQPSQMASSSLSATSPENLSSEKPAVDPYADLDPWGKASLNRFAAMLREESRAETNKDKLNIFNVFTSRESRLRVVLYGTEEDLVTSPKHAEIPISRSEGQVASTIPNGIVGVKQSDSFVRDGLKIEPLQRTNTLGLQRSLKALPALPANRDSVINLPEDPSAPLETEEVSKSFQNHKSSSSESAMDEVQYSPGGRPLGIRLSRIPVDQIKDTPETTSEPSESTAGANESYSLSANTQDAVETQHTVAGAMISANVPVENNGPRSEVRNYLANRKSIIRPYATLTQGSLDSGSNFGRGSDISEMPAIPTKVLAPTSQFNPHAKPSLENSAEAFRKSHESATESHSNLRRFVKADFDPLVTILPASEAIAPESLRLGDLRNVLEAVPDDFSFIHQCVVAWDVRARKQREENDRQRHARQIESEQRIDSLFDDHEIGYGDISELESEFKRSEAARRADEDRSEYQLFVTDVFNLVWERLHYELDQLIPHYEHYSSSMNSALAGKSIFEESHQSLPLAPLMGLFLTLHQKIEIRHQKAFEAVLERNRRLKKTEISPWYTLSNIAKVKHLEKQFEDSEKEAIQHYCKERNERANHLMDVLDQNTLRGVGANQDYMEAIWKAVRRIASGRAFASVSGSNEPTAGMEEVEKAQAVTALLATSSEQIVQTFHVADMLLNSADYEVSVARAKAAEKIDHVAIATLKEARTKEDQKLMRDLEHRLALIREDTRRTNDEIVKLMLFLGVKNGRADSGSAVRLRPSDPEHEARIQKALEEAKKRNASKESVI